MIEVSQSK